MKLSDDLRRSVLQAAIQGKLTEQHSDDGNAEDLLKEIRAGKKKLIAEGKIKKDKPLPPIDDDEKPFEIPDNWAWVRLGEIGYFVRGNGIKRAETTETGKPCIRYGQLYTTYKNSFKKSKSFTSEEIFEKSVKINKNDILMALTGENNIDIALAVAYLGEDEIAMGGDMTKFTHTINSMYIVAVINSAYTISCKSKLATGNIIVHISNDKLASIPFPLPPLAEQERIVERLEKIMKKIDELDEAETELEALKKKFPGDLRDSLLQAAIQGKLTEQRPEDGNAEDLLKQIRAGKKKLIAEGKIKKEKPLPPITDDEKPFEIPDNWAWVKFTDIFYKITDGTHSTPKYTESGIPFLSVKDISSGKIDLTNTKFISQEEHSELYKRCNPEKGDLLITKVGTTGVPAIVDTDIEFSLFVSVALLKFFHNSANINYLYYSLKSPLVQEQAKENTRGVGNKNWVLDAVKNTIFPLPPLAEQERIVERLNELLPLCEAIKEE